MSYPPPTRSELQSQASGASSHELHLPYRPVLGGSDLLQGVPKNILHKFGVGVCEELLNDRIEVAVEWNRLDDEAKKFRNPHRYYKDYYMKQEDQKALVPEADVSGGSTYEKMGRVAGNIAPNKSRQYDHSHSQATHSHEVHRYANRAAVNDERNKRTTDEFKQYNERVYVDKLLEKSVNDTFPSDKSAPPANQTRSTAASVKPSRTQTRTPAVATVKPQPVSEMLPVNRDQSVAHVPPSSDTSSQKKVQFNQEPVKARNSLYRTNVRIE